MDACKESKRPPAPEPLVGRRGLENKVRKGKKKRIIKEKKKGKEKGERNKIQLNDCFSHQKIDHAKIIIEVIPIP